MLPADLRPGDQVMWNGNRVSVSDVTGTPGQAHPWLVELVFEDEPDKPTALLSVPANHRFEVAF